MAELRRVFIELMNERIDVPVIVKRSYSGLDDEDLTLYSATDIGGLLLDGLGDGVWINADNSIEVINRVSFGILQATRTRISKTEYISCPSCGRTQFDLQETTAMIKKRTDHLKGVKIAIMGCIVNGPGEMADADYGFVGSGPDWVSLYRGKDVIERGIPYPEALDKLIAIMKEDGIWVEPA
jgi:(E)-4-hydroxy-3-methylbut-2-enyl-diphosphate synthase